MAQTHGSRRGRSGRLTQGAAGAGKIAAVRPGTEVAVPFAEFLQRRTNAPPHPLSTFPGRPRTGRLQRAWRPAGGENLFRPVVCSGAWRPRCSHERQSRARGGHPAELGHRSGCRSERACCRRADSGQGRAGWRWPPGHDRRGCRYGRACRARPCRRRAGCQAGRTRAAHPCRDPRPGTGRKSGCRGTRRRGICHACAGRTGTDRSRPRRLTWKRRCRPTRPGTRSRGGGRNSRWPGRGRFGRPAIGGCIAAGYRRDRRGGPGPFAWRRTGLSCPLATAARTARADRISPGWRSVTAGSRSDGQRPTHPGHACGGPGRPAGTWQGCCRFAAAWPHR